MRFRLLIVVAVTLCVFGGYAIGIALGTTVPGLLSGLALSALAAAAAAWAVAQAQPGAPRLVAEALAERYADNFLFVIMETLADSPPDSIAGPYRVLVLIPESTEAQERLASEVAQVSTTIEIPSPTGGRSYGVYAYPDPRGTRVVDVPSTLRGLGTLVSRPLHPLRRSPADVGRAERTDGHFGPDRPERPPVSAFLSPRPTRHAQRVTLTETLPTSHVQRDAANDRAS
jgi:hypothetical protein